jgi:hypothetical protein
MNEQEVVQRSVEVLTNRLPDDVVVRTEGGGNDLGLPSVTITWSAERLRRLHGHEPFAGVVHNEEGEIVGEEYHMYHEIRLDCLIKTQDQSSVTLDKSYGESGRDQLIDDVQKAFVRFEQHPEKFHDDAYEFQVGNTIARSRPEKEPNWYETDQVVTFRYLKRMIETDVDTIGEIGGSISAGSPVEIVEEFTLDGS